MLLNVSVVGEPEGPGTRPSDNSVYRPGEDRYPAGAPYRPGSGGNRYPPGSGGSSGDKYPPRYPPKYPPSGGGYDKYRPRPPTHDRYPEYDDRYPDDRGGSRYPIGPGYPPSSSGKYPYYPPSSSGKPYYPPSSSGKPYYPDR